MKKFLFNGAVILTALFCLSITTGLVRAAEAPTSVAALAQIGLAEERLPPISPIKAELFPKSRQDHTPLVDQAAGLRRFSRPSQLSALGLEKSVVLATGKQ